MPKAGRELIDVDVEEVSLVPRAANKKRFLFLKGLGEGRGVGGDPQGIGGADYCVCSKCGYSVKHEKAGAAKSLPCLKIKCPECGTPLKGSKTKKLPEGGEGNMLDKVKKIADVLDNIELGEDTTDELKEGVTNLKKELDSLDAALAAEDKARVKAEADAKGAELKKDVESELGKINTKLDKIIDIVDKIKVEGYPAKGGAEVDANGVEKAKELEKAKDDAVTEALTALKDLSDKMLSKEDIGNMIAEAVSPKA